MDFEQPTHAPTTEVTSSPIDRYVDFRSGKGIAADIASQIQSPGDSVGFFYYNKETQSRHRINGGTFWIIGVYAQVAGAVKMSEREYRNYTSNLVIDTRTDIISLKEIGGRELIKGMYPEVKAYIQSQGRNLEGVGYRKVVVCYSEELQKVVAITANAKFEQALKKAIAAASDTKPGKINLLGLTALATEVWGFHFGGQWERVNAEGDKYEGKGEMYFQPLFKAGVARAGGKYNDTHQHVAAIQDAMYNYISNGQAYLKKDDKSADYTPHHSVTQTQGQSTAKEGGFPDLNKQPVFDTFEDLPF